MSAKDYRTKVALPLVQKLKKVIFNLTIRCADALEKVKKYKIKSNALQTEVNTLAKKVREQQSDIFELNAKAQTLEDLKEYFGTDKIEEIRQAAEQRREAGKVQNVKSKNRGIAI